MSQLDRWHKLGDAYINDKLLKRLLEKQKMELTLKVVIQLIGGLLGKMLMTK